MAETLVSIATEKLGNAAQKQLELFAGAADKLVSLKGTFEAIQALLVDAESRQIGDEHIRLWLSKLRAASYDIDDVLDEWEIISSVDDQQDESSSNGRSWVASKACKSFLYFYDCLGYAVSRQKVAWSIKDIMKRLDQIDDDKNKYSFSSTSVGVVQNQMPVVVRSERVTTSEIDESEMIFGREADKKFMISKLLGESSSSHGHGKGQVDVVGIVGMEGLGKTTLARQIYNDSKVRGHFDTFLWVCVTDVFNVIRLTKAILEQIPRTNTFLSELESLKIELGRSLRGKRFLLVLDDVWNEDEKKWKELGVTLNKSGEHGSRILVTTRNEKVAITMNATYIHDLKGLSESDSWDLFCSRAFVRRKKADQHPELFTSEAWKEREKYPALESVAKEIVLKCKGVPLSIQAIASAMQSIRNLEEWKNVLSSKIWSLPQVAGEIMPALLLTYYYLPMHLKQCFAYCSVFPKDTVLEKDLLVRLWVAQGFIRSEGNREIEDIGSEYFDKLVARSLFQEVKEVHEGKITCKMHDLAHDLAEFISKDEIYTFDSSTSDGEKSSQCPRINGDVRHAHLTLSKTLENITISFGDAKKLRSCILEAYGTVNDNFDSLSQARFLRALYFCSPPPLPESMFKLKHLRYLRIGNSKIVELPKAIGQMRQLMYLDLSGTGIRELPESVVRLHNLHTLNLNRCRELKKLPRGMGRMVSLRHLGIEETNSLECLPGGLCENTSLRTLSKFIVGGGGGCGIDELRALNSLEGSLEIVNLERVSSREEAEKAQLYNKSHLRCVVLRMAKDAERERMQGVLEGLKPHPMLEKVELYNYPSSRLPSWMEEMPCRRKLFLSSCPKLEWVPHHLSNSPLTQLTIEYCDGIKGIECSSSLAHLEELELTESSDFFSSGLPDLPNLKTLKIKRYANETLPEGGWDRLPALQRLEICFCQELKCLPDGLAQLQLLQDLRIIEIRELQLLPEALGQLRKLKRLAIWGLTALTHLPDSIGQLESLERLEIWDCYALGSLPQGLQQLSLLQQLRIQYCYQLSERCKREEGVDWPKISHIPDIIVNGKIP